MATPRGPYRGARPGTGGGSKDHSIRTKQPRPTPPARGRGPYQGAHPGAAPAPAPTQTVITHQQRRAQRTAKLNAVAPNETSRASQAVTLHALATAAAQHAAHINSLENASAQREYTATHPSHSSALDSILHDVTSPLHDAYHVLPSGVRHVLDTKVPGTEYAAKLGVLAATHGADISAAQKAPKVSRATVGQLGLAAVPEAAYAARASRVGAGAQDLAKADRAAVDAMRPEGRAAPAARTTGEVAPKASRYERAKAAIQNRPRPVKAATARVGETKAAQKVGSVAEKIKATRSARVAKKVTDPLRYPTRKLGEHPVLGAVGGVEGPGLAAAATGKHDFGKKLLAPIEGTGKALLHPEQTGAATLHAAEGLVTTPVGLAANAGLTAGRAASTGLHDLGVPGMHKYSGKEIAAPSVSSYDAIKNFAKDYYKTYSSGDPNLIAKKTETEYGIGQLLPLLGAARARAVREGKITENPGVGMGHIPAVKTRRIRKQASRARAAGDRQAVVQGTHLGHETDAILGHRGRHFRAKGKGNVGPEHMVAVAAKEGATKPEHITEAQAARNNGVRNSAASGTDKGFVTVHDVHPQDVNHPRVEKATAAVRREQPNVETSDIKKNESQFITANHVTNGEIQHPHDVVLKKGTMVPDPTTKSGFRKLSADTGWFKEPAGGWTNSEAHLRQRAIDNFIAERELTKLEKWRQETGRVAPVYVKSVPAKVSADSGIKDSTRGTVGRMVHKVDHASEAKLNKAGMEDVSYEQTKLHSFFEPRAKHEINTNAVQQFETRAKSFDVLKADGTPVPARGHRNTGKSRVLTQAERDAWVAAHPDEAKNIIWLDSQTHKAAVYDKKAGRMVDLPDNPPATLSESLKMAYERLDKQRGTLAKGPAYIGVDKRWGEEFLNQYREQTGRLDKLARGSQRAASKLLLGYSPSWLLAQPIAESAQALAAVGPYQILKGRKRYAALSDADKRRLDAAIGATAGTGSIDDALADIKGRQGKGAVTVAARNARQGLSKNPVGRVVEGIITGRYANEIDRAKGLEIRRWVAAAHLEREYNGLTGALRNLTRRQTELDQTMRKLDPQQRLEYVAQHPRAAAEVERYVDDVMGNWSALTSNERAAAAAVVFYPFIRMSLEWTLFTYPARHPLKAAVLQFLGQENAKQVDNLLGGKPSFFNQWATVPLYAGTGKNLGKPTSLLPLQRIAPGGNAITEAVGSGAGPHDFLRVINPIAAAGAAALGGYDPQSGRFMFPQFSQLNWGQVGRSFGGSLANMPSIARIADKATGGDFIRTKIQGKAETPATKLIDKLSPNQLLNAIIPMLPESTAKERAKAEIGRLIDRAHAADNVDLGAASQKGLQAALGNKGAIEAKKQDLIKALDAVVAKHRLDTAEGQPPYKRRVRQTERALNAGPTAAQVIVGLERSQNLSQGQAVDQVRQALGRGVTLEQLKELLKPQGTDTPLTRSFNDVIKSAKKQGFKAHTITRGRRGRARKLMGND